MYIESLSGSLRNDFRTVLLALVPSRAISRFICRTPIYFFLFLSPKFDGVYLRKKCADCTSVLTDHTRDRLLSERIMYG